jgi:predicted MPP superfamily phosphohydrolase
MRHGTEPSERPELPPEGPYVSLAPPTHFSHEPSSITRRAFLATGAAAAAGLALYAGTHARHELEIVRRTILIRDLPDSFQGFRIAQISDIHLVEWTEPWFLRRVVAEVNKLAPDLVALTGDFISRGPRSVDVAHRAMPVCAEALSELQCPQRFAILGNHDVVVDPGMVVRALADRGIPTLVNSFTAIERGSDLLWLCGVDDPGASVPYLSAAIPKLPGAPVILLAHEPDYADNVRRHPRFPLIDLMLSGHSHGGQVRLPWIGPLVLPPLGQKYVSGLFRFAQMQLYVNRGIGTVGVPFRFDCPPEITEITLQRA